MRMKNTRFPRWLLTLALVAGCHKAERAAPAWAENTTYSYALDMLSSAGTDAVPVPIFTLGVKGRLEISSAGSDERSQQLALSFKELVVSSSSDDKARAASFKSALEQPMQLELRNGLVESLRIKAESDYMAVAFVRSIASALQVAQGKETEASDYEAREYDSTGRYVAHYKRPDASHVHKEKVRYETLLDVSAQSSVGPKLQKAGKPEFQSSAVDVTLEGAVPKSVKMAESTTVALMEASKLSYSTRLSLQLLASKAGAAGPAGGLVALPASQPYAPAPRLGDLDALRIGDLSFADTVAQLEHFANDSDPASLAKASAGDAGVDPELSEATQARNRTFSALAAYYRKEPAYIEKAHTLIREGSPAAKWLISGFGSAGTQAGQDALLRTIKDKGLPKPLRKAAGLSLLQANAPTRATAAAVERLLADPEWQQYATYAVGIYSRRMREEGQPAEADRLSALLTSKLASAVDTKQIVELLGGISNSADPAVVPAVKRYLARSEPEVREAAVQALRLIDSPEADRLIAHALSTDQVFKVRMLAADTARERSTPRQPLADAVARAASSDQDPRVRTMAVRTLGAWLPGKPQLRNVIDDIMQKDDDPNVVLIAKAVLSARDG